MHWRFSKVIGRNLWLLIFVKRRGCHYIQLKVTVEPDRIFFFNLKVWLTLLLVQRGFIVTSPCMHKMHLDDIHLLCDSPHYTQTHFLQFSSVSLFYFHSADRVLWFFFGMDGWLWWQALLLVKGIFKAQDITGSFSCTPSAVSSHVQDPGWQGARAAPLPCPCAHCWTASLRPLTLFKAQDVRLEYICVHILIIL